MDRITNAAPNYAKNVRTTTIGHRWAREAVAGLNRLIDGLERHPQDPTAIVWLQRAEQARDTLQNALR